VCLLDTRAAERPEQGTRPDDMLILLGIDSLAPPTGGAGDQLSHVRAVNAGIFSARSGLGKFRAPCGRCRRHCRMIADLHVVPPHTVCPSDRGAILARSRSGYGRRCNLGVIWTPPTISFRRRIGIMSRMVAGDRPPPIRADAGPEVQQPAEDWPVHHAVIVQGPKG
jgi:hypothetical protein